MTLDQHINNRTPGYFARLARARRLYRAIAEHIGAGGTVMVATYTRGTVYSSMDWFRLNGTDVEVCRGRAWDSIMFSRVGFSRKAS